MAGVIDTMLFSLVHDFFKVYLPHQKKSSPHTIRAYQTALESLFNFIKEKKNIGLSEITFEMLDSKILAAFLCFGRKRLRYIYPQSSTELYSFFFRLCGRNERFWDIYGNVFSFQRFHSFFIGNFPRHFSVISLVSSPLPDNHFYHDFLIKVASRASDKSLAYFVNFPSRSKVQKRQLVGESPNPG